MAIFAVTYTYAPDSVTARDEHRPVHREYLGGLSEQGVLLGSGPWGADEEPGALLLFRADSKEEALALAEKDPFHLRGLIARIGVREWVPVMGPLTEHL